MATQLKALEEVQVWIDSGRELRQRLVAERDEILMRLAEIDAALASLPSDSDDSDSTPEKVRRVLRSAAEPLTAPQVIEALRTSDPLVEARLVHTALYRMAKAKEVVREGERGSLMYRLVAGQAETTS